MSFIKKGTSALGKLISVVILAAAFLVGMVGVLYMSLQGSEIKVPEIVGKNFQESEKELESLGLRIKKRADRYSEEAPNTVLEQLPKPGDTVKTGQMILVVTSKPNAEGEEKPATIQKGNVAVEDDSDRIEELITDKPKKKDANNNNNKKKTSTTRDVIKNSNTSSSSSTDNKNTGVSDKTPNKDNKNAPPSSTPKPTPATATPKPTAAKTPTTSGDTRDRRSPNN